MPLLINTHEVIILITSESGVRFRLRIVRAGEAYGRTNALTADRDLVEFYDTRYDHTEFGQFVQRYYVETLLDDRCPAHPGYRYGDEGCRHGFGGLNLDTNAGEDWWIDPAAMDVVRAWLRLEIER